jgi:ankyrin repeat protein
MPKQTWVYHFCLICYIQVITLINTNLKGWTPLHSAAFWNAFRIVEYFIKYTNVDVNSASDGGQTPLHLAAQNSKNRETSLVLLMSPFINFSQQNDQEDTALDIAKRSSKFHDLYEIGEDYLNYF